MPASETTRSPRGENAKPNGTGAAGGGHDRRAEAAEAQRERLDAVGDALGDDELAPVGGDRDLRGAGARRRAARPCARRAACPSRRRRSAVTFGVAPPALRTYSAPSAMSTESGSDAAGRLAVDERQVPAAADAERRDVVGAGVDGDHARGRRR